MQSIKNKISNKLHGSHHDNTSTTHSGHAGPITQTAIIDDCLTLPGDMREKGHGTPAVVPMPAVASTTTTTTSEAPLLERRASPIMERREEIVYEPVTVLEPAPVMREQLAFTGVESQKTIVEAPLIMERVEKAVVVQEHIHPIQKEEIQPVIYREREQLEIQQITERLHETQINPTLVEKRELAPQVREAVVMRGAAIEENYVAATVVVDTVERSQMVHQPIVQETIKKTIIEEIQPVLEKDIIQTTVIQQTQPIYEKIVEAPIVVRSVLPERELGVRQEVYSATPVTYMQPVVRETFVEVEQPRAHAQPLTTTTTTTVTSAKLPSNANDFGTFNTLQNDKDLHTKGLNHDHKSGNNITTKVAPNEFVQTR